MHPKEKVTTALKKAKSSIEKILISVEKKDPDCFSIIQQNLAVIGLLKSANLLMLENHTERSIQKITGLKNKQGKEFQSELLKILQTAQNK